MRRIYLVSSQHLENNVPTSLRVCSRHTGLQIPRETLQAAQSDCDVHDIGNRIFHRIKIFSGVRLDSASAALFKWLMNKKRISTFYYGSDMKQTYSEKRVWFLFGISSDVSTRK